MNSLYENLFAHLCVHMVNNKNKKINPLLCSLDFCEQLFHKNQIKYAALFSRSRQSFSSRSAMPCCVHLIAVVYVPIRTC